MLKSISSYSLAVAGMVTLLSGPANADVKLPAIFSNGLVLQRDLEVPVWGWADPGEEVTVTFRDQSKTVTADPHGNWKVKLSPSPVVAEPTTLSVSGKNHLNVEDVLVGEVWLASGQSNMGWSVSQSLDPDLEVEAANFPSLRLFHVDLDTRRETQTDVTGSWRPAIKQNITHYSAVSYFFGRQLQQTLNIPVGILHSSWGGTVAEAWASPEMFESHPQYQPIFERWEELLESADFVKGQAEFEAELAKWEVAKVAAHAEGKPAPRRPVAKDNTQESRHYPSNLYRAMISPIAGYGIRGAIWYQGESNADRAYQYRTLMPDVIQSWRTAWGQGDFHFYQVQLANFTEIVDQPGESHWAELREAQAMAKHAIPNVDAVCITDIGAAKDIHPKDKQNVSKRLARLALVDLYGYKNITRQGPEFKEAKFEGNKAVVSFNTYGQNLISYYDEPLTGFALAGEDRKFVWAKGEIDAKTGTVTLTAEGVETPVAVRYNWANNPQGNLYNATYLPAYPFRSDDWEGLTAKKVKP